MKAPTIHKEQKWKKSPALSDQPEALESGGFISREKQLSALTRLNSRRCCRLLVPRMLIQRCHIVGCDERTEVRSQGNPGSKLFDHFNPLGLG